ncbi:MAG: prepilin-type N-terminal cleavage/methylation domain-containing protein [Candidatus Aminicenantes bacterium]|nr:MAG: prepilin-type N-terminal cleavage/methylation domain-containing protein [Candidatus Aminicenantes bacterium]
MMDKPTKRIKAKRGYTLIEAVIGSAIMMIVLVATLSLYVKSNKTSVDQQQFSELQHDVRFIMFLMSRDIKSVGAGLPQEFAGYFLEGVNNDPYQSGAVQSDRLAILGNSDPLTLAIDTYNPGTGTITLEADEFDRYHYENADCLTNPAGYINRTILILPRPELNNTNGELGQITGVDINNDQLTFTQINVPLPNGLLPGGVQADYSGGTVHFIEYKIYWLDVDGSYPGLSEGQDGYLGQEGVLYISQWNPLSAALEHLPLAQNIEDLQFQYHGDIDGDQVLDDNNSNGGIDQSDFLNWDNTTWTNDPTLVAGLRRLRFWICGRTENPFISFSGAPPDEVKYIYGKPPIADSPQSASADKHKRFLLESIANLRNMSLNIYNASTI